MKRWVSGVMVLFLCVAVGSAASAQGAKGGAAKGGAAKGGAAKDKAPDIKTSEEAKESEEYEGKGIGPAVREAVRAGLRGTELAAFIHKLNAERGVGKPGGPGAPEQVEESKDKAAKSKPEKSGKK